jgi:signal transduction histidine kinase
MALCLLAVHAHFQGDQIGVPMAVLAVIVLVTPTAVLNEGDVHDELLIFYESVFAAAALATVALVGRFRTAESASRLRARDLSRRTIRAEHEIRREVSRSLHDGPVQELIGLDMTLAAAHNEAAKLGAESLAAMLNGAREMAERNVQALRDEMLDLGPYAYEEFSLEAAVERCLPIWQRRYGLAAHPELERLELSSEVEGELFRIIQEAVVNAARHGGASNVTIALTGRGEEAELVVRDDGSGFDGVDPLGQTEPGHLGLASMRERTELMDGRLTIVSSQEGTTVRVRVQRSRRGRRSTVG